MRAILSAAMMLAASSALAAQEPPAAAPGEAPPPSPAMSVAAFLERLGAVSRSGPGWTETPEAAQLFEAVAGAGKAYRRDLEARRAAGQPVEACLPPTAEIDSDDLLAHLVGLAPDQARRTTIAEAFAAVVRQRFACP
jgi:hypothetical protein